MDSVIYFKWVLFLLLSSQLTYLDMNCFGGSSSSVSLGFWSLAELLLICFSHEWFQDLSEMWVYRIWEGLLGFLFFFASSILCDCDFSNSSFLISTLACLYVVPTAIGLRLKPWKWESTLYNVPPKHGFFRLLILVLCPHFIVVLWGRIILAGFYSILTWSGYQ